MPSQQVLALHIWSDSAHKFLHAQMLNPAENTFHHLHHGNIDYAACHSTSISSRLGRGFLGSFVARGQACGA